METKEIKEILSEIGITEDNCEIVSENDDYGGCEMCIGYYPELVEAIQKFMNHLENQQDNGKTDEFGNYFIKED